MLYGKSYLSDRCAGVVRRGCAGGCAEVVRRGCAGVVRVVRELCGGCAGLVRGLCGGCAEKLLDKKLFPYIIVYIYKYWRSPSAG